MATTIWIVFIAFVLILVVMDLLVFNSKPHEVSSKEAIKWTLVWVGVALVFNVALYFMYESPWFHENFLTSGLNGQKAAMQFLTGYVIEKSLSVDNIFVIAMIFDYFRVPLRFQHRVLFWGIFGALVFRGIMIGVGAVLISQFTWMTYIFGGILLITAVKMLKDKDNETIDLEHTFVVRYLNKHFKIYNRIEDEHFTKKIHGRLHLTPLFLALLSIETADVVFAVDSIPAIFAVTMDPFIVFTSNVFAIMGLRSLYFVLAAMINKFEHLKFSLIFILVFVGIKMMVVHHFAIPTWLSLVFILGALLTGVASSLRANRLKED